MHIWQLQEAKAKLSEVVRLATFEGPQSISIRGEQAIILLSKKDYENLCKKQMSFIEMMASSPFKNIDLNLERDHSPSRHIDL